MVNLEIDDCIRPESYPLPMSPASHDLRLALLLIKNMTPSGLRYMGGLAFDVASKWLSGPRANENAHTHCLSCMHICDGRIATMRIVLLNDSNRSSYDSYLDAGYRRFGRSYYCYACSGCDDCASMRVRTAEVEQGRAERRIARRNSTVKVRVRRPKHTREKARLLKDYLTRRHGIKSTGLINCADVMLHEMFHSPFTVEMDYTLDDELVGVGAVDMADNALSSVYFFYDTRMLRNRIGIFSYLALLEFARAMGKKYVYMGHHSPRTPKLSYKARFRPYEVLRPEGWKECRA